MQISTRNLVKIILVVTLFFLISSVQLSAQDSSSHPGIGLSASVQGTQYDIMLPIWAADEFVIAPAVGLVWSQDQATDLELGIELRKYFNPKKIAPFIGGRFGVFVTSPSVGNSFTDGFAGLAFGAEYFIDRNFSFGVEGQANLSFSSDKSTRFGNPGKKNFNTATAAFFTVYF